MMILKTKQVRFTMAILSCCALLISSCEDDQITSMPEPTNPSDIPIKALHFPDGNGFCAAMISSTSYIDPVTEMEYDIEIGSAISGFTDDNWSSYMRAGTVICNSEHMQASTNNLYAHDFSDNQNDAIEQGIEFSEQADWVVGGSNGIFAFSYTTNMGFPSMGELAANNIVDRNTNYNIVLSDVGNADNIIYQIGTVFKIVNGNTTSVSFSSDELSDLPLGPSYVQTTAYGIEPTTVQGANKIYFVNQRSKSLIVNIE